MKSILYLLLANCTWLGWLSTEVVRAADLCQSTSKTFTVAVDLFAGELGYYYFVECPDMQNPTIGMEIGQTYTFVQQDTSNWYHPMGFAYFPDGAHDEKDELEPTVTQTSSACVASNECPSPRYYRNNTFLGKIGTEDFGLDVYEPEFFLSLADWAAGGTRSIELNFNDESYTKDIFYFCHIHQFMTGRIKLLKNGKAVSSSNVPLLGYKYDMLSEFDKLCGTHDLNDFQLPSNNQCPDKFVCTSDSTPATMKAYARCIDAMNCHMLAGMTTGVTAKSAAALFLHQMIPHHQNAVNMAKTLLILENEFICDDITDTELPDCVLESILRDIVNNQNFQIQQMFGILEIDEYEEKDDCKILIERNLRKTKNSLGTSHRDNQRANHLVLDEAVESQNVTKMNSLSIISEEKTDRRAQGGICISATKTFTVIVDLFAGALGYYTFKECPGLINPTIGIEIGETHVFDQSDRSNWYHPMGFSYFPDGAHDGKAELELNITQTKSICTSNASCPAPRYLKNGLYMGVPGTLDFGLDAYEPEFFAGLVDWTKAGKYSISLNFDDFAFGKDIFYFCHIHQYMSGRIKLLKNGIPVNNADLPELGYQYDSISSFDASCGTFDLESSRLPQTECPDRFVCVPDSVNDDGLRVFASCIDAMNCFMLKGMTTGVSASSPTALFIHQMIPHHQNAVNMAKALLHFKNEVEQKQEVNCPDLTDEESSDCILEVILRQIVNAQNHQIQQMRGILTAKAFPESDDCGVTVDTVRNGQCPSDTDCKMLLIFPGNRVHKRFLGSRFCLSVCTSFPPSLYLNSGWDCGGCGD